jgi:hypothetical protein
MKTAMAARQAAGMLRGAPDRRAWGARRLWALTAKGERNSVYAEFLAPTARCAEYACAAANVPLYRVRCPERRLCVIPPASLVSGKAMIAGLSLPRG